MGGEQRLKPEGSCSGRQPGRRSYSLAFVSPGTEGWSEGRWRTASGKNSRRTTARWLLAMACSAQNRTDDILQINLASQKTSLRNWFFFFGGGRIVLFSFLIFSTGWLFLPLCGQRQNLQRCPFGFCCSRISPLVLSGSSQSSSSVFYKMIASLLIERKYFMKEKVLLKCVWYLLI